MRRNKVFLGLSLAVTLLLSATSCNSQESKVELKTASDTMSWILGENFARGLKESNVELNKAVILKAVEATLDGKPSLVDNITYQEGLDNFALALHMAQQEKAKATFAQQQQQLQQLAVNDPQLKLDERSGIYYKVVKEGKGPKAPEKMRVRFNYEGRLLDGTVFDNSFGTNGIINLPVNLMQGVGYSLTLMNAGSRYIFYIPSHLAFGANGSPQLNIPGDAIVVYEIELYEILKD
ncbi:MAG: FKBP-type peptidyl-prolyl cis-trans isomerase [Bacteroidales bacterium]|jgi:FKBP-type peptidyl-prolyl cis-trans isomerase|nr:FKBP-type peptidyl-prolyl cis-trans isomerase [Bacteroidales bacterium]MBP5241468.1 FKBP-type peptidyl-prolyl cis-trans isomerase [Bacteroidales bacterium]MBP5759295.1 FKBP-type peptidyl-prolyl cis-trans isomerase [Bacteroidales bacterium]